MLAGILLGLSLHAEEQPAKVVLGQAIDFLDNTAYTDKADYYSLEELRARVKLSYDAGIRRVYFRGTGGVTYYPSSVRRMYTGSHNNEIASKLYKTIHSYDTVAEYIKICHELGMELYYWEPIFDTSLYARNYPGTEDYANFGAMPTADLNVADEHYVKHRLADVLPVQALTGVISEIRLHAARAIESPVTAENLIIYTAQRNANFRRYDKPFTVEVAGDDVIIRGLCINEPVLKFGGDVKISSDLGSHDAVKAFYSDGRQVELFLSCEVVLDGDKYPEKILHGTSGYLCGWGQSVANRTLIVRFGDFDRHALGIPDYSLRVNRERLEKIVAELYERYPELDGVLFSLRSHSLPCPGDSTELGYGRLFYGFSDIVCDTYQRLYGIDPRREAYDEQLFLKLRGEFFTQMLEGVSKIIHSHGGKFSVMAPVRGVDSIAHGSMYPWLQHYNIDNYFDIETWAKRGIVDTVMMLGTGHQQSKWTKEWKDEVQAFKKKIAGTNTRLALHYLSNGDEKGDCLKSLLPEILKENAFDEVEFYEEFYMYAVGHYTILKQFTAVP